MAAQIADIEELLRRMGIQSSPLPDPVMTEVDEWWKRPQEPYQIPGAPTWNSDPAMAGTDSSQMIRNLLGPAPTDPTDYAPRHGDPSLAGTNSSKMLGQLGTASMDALGAAFPRAATQGAQISDAIGQFGADPSVRGFGKILGLGTRSVGQNAQDAYRTAKVGAGEAVGAISGAAKNLGTGVLEGLFATGKNDPSKQVRRGPGEEKGAPRSPVSDVPSYSTKADAAMQDLLGMNRSLDRMAGEVRDRPIPGLRSSQGAINPNLTLAGNPVGPPAIEGPGEPVGPSSISREDLARDLTPAELQEYRRPAMPPSVAGILGASPAQALMGPGGAQGLAAAYGWQNRGPQIAGPANLPAPAGPAAAPASATGAGVKPFLSNEVPTGPDVVLKKPEGGGLYGTPGRRRMFRNLGRVGDTFLRDIQNASRIGAGLPEDRSPLEPDILEEDVRRDEETLTEGERKMLEAATGTPIPEGARLSRIKALSDFMEAGTRAKATTAASTANRRSRESSKVQNAYNKMTNSTQQALGDLEKAKGLLSQANSSVADVATTYLMPRVMREVGNLSESEKSAFRRRWGFQGTWDTINQWVTGRFSQGQRSEMLDMLNYLGETMEREKVRLGSVISRQSSKLQPDLFDEDELLDTLNSGQRLLENAKGQRRIFSAAEWQRLVDEGHSGDYRVVAE